MNLLITFISLVQLIVAIAVISVVTALMGKLAGTIAAVGLLALYMFATYFFRGEE